jgi:hypothetical protein
MATLQQYRTAKTMNESTSSCRQSQVNALHVRHIIYIDQAHRKSGSRSGHDPENLRASPSPDGMRAKPHSREAWNDPIEYPVEASHNTNLIARDLP